MGNSPFAPATREQLKGRIAIDGPTGSGKTWSALAIATAMAEAEGGKIAVVDTERRSASLYSDRYTFETLPWLPPYDPRKLAEVLATADATGEYAVFVVDSLTHFWKGKGGVMDIVDAAGRRSGGNNFAGWKEGTPALQTLIDTMLGLNSHFIGTMRSKMEHLLVEDDRGRKVPQKVGMAPEMRGDIEYEFTVCLSFDLGHTGIVTKSRCEELADLMVPAGITNLQEMTDRFLTWLREGAAPAELIDEAERARLQQWANNLAPALRSDLRQLWPIGVPILRDPSLTKVQADRVEAVLQSLAPEGESGDDGEGGDDDTDAPNDAGADENGDPLPAKAPAKKAAAKKAPAKKAAAKKAPAQRAAEHAEGDAEVSPAKAELERMADEVAAGPDGPAQPNEADPEAQPDEAPPDEAGPDEAATSAEGAADDPSGTEVPDEGAEAAQGDTASVEGDGEPEAPAAGEPIDWKVEGKNMGLGAAAVLQQVRDLAAEKGLDLPPTLSRVPDDAQFQGELMARLTAIAAAKAAREQD